MTVASEETIRAYSEVLRYAIMKLRARIRDGETVANEELHDLLDAIHNIPQMLAAYGDWFVEENIDWQLRDYDAKWLGRQPKGGYLSLIETLERAKKGDVPF